MNKYCMIEVAFGNKKELKTTINILLNRHLASGCQTVKSKSIWNWKKKREQSLEYLLFIKTKKSLTSEVYNVVKSIHSYECFEFAVFSLESNNNEYLEWIKNETI